MNVEKSFVFGGILQKCSELKDVLFQLVYRHTYLYKFLKYPPLDSVCACMCAHTRVCVNTRMYICRGSRATLDVILRSSIYFLLRQGLSLFQSLPIKLDWLITESQVFYCLYEFESSLFYIEFQDYKMKSCLR